MNLKFGFDEPIQTEDMVLPSGATRGVVSGLTTDLEVQILFKMWNGRVSRVLTQILMSCF